MDCAGPRWWLPSSSKSLMGAKSKTHRYHAAPSLHALEHIFGSSPLTWSVMMEDPTQTGAQSGCCPARSRSAPGDA